LQSVDPLLHDQVKTTHMFENMSQIKDAFD